LILNIFRNSRVFVLHINFFLALKISGLQNRTGSVSQQKRMGVLSVAFHSLDTGH